MIEVLFTESAAGSILSARQVEWNTRISAKIDHQMEENHRNVVCFPLSLSMGDLSDPLSDHRAAFIQSMVLIPGSDFSNIGQTEVSTARESLEKVLAAIEDGQPIRIWYSQNPDELCGLFHLLTILPANADIRVVELPRYEVHENTLLSYSGWGEVNPMELGSLQRLEWPLTAIERRYFANMWRELQRENGPLRAVINGRLCTVGTDFYDHFILRELQKQPSEFHEARLIGEILGRYQLGISDSLIALRIEDFISRGMLEPITQPGEDRPIYHRYLRKVKL
ncbi:MAG: DUF1835 domain-containing protein [Ruminococcaceae bacterium]|nr:DUF1835 domain-containing protein [Oscillospiraceae bacterium]